MGGKNEHFVFRPSKRLSLVVDHWGAVSDGLSMTVAGASSGYDIAPLWVSIADAKLEGQMQFYPLATKQRARGLAGPLPIGLIWLDELLGLGLWVACENATGEGKHQENQPEISHKPVISSWQKEIL